MHFIVINKQIFVRTLLRVCGTWIEGTNINKQIFILHLAILGSIWTISN